MVKHGPRKRLSSPITLAQCVGREIVKLRVYKNLTQMEVAKIAVVTQSRWSRFESGMFLTVDTLFVICSALGVLPSDVMKRAEESLSWDFEHGANE
jgi:transcriptional regulator with XRE-family HTH domain